MKNIFGFIPNSLTLCNLIAGCVAIVSAFKGAPDIAFWAIIAAAVFDFFDGFAARLLKAYSPIGADLDSLSDMVSFGVAPSVMIFVAIEPSAGIWAWGAFLLAIGAALRLAKFNVDTRQTLEFRGLPTPAMAMFFISLQFFAHNMEVWHTLSLVMIFTLLMVSDIPLFALKFKDFSIKNNLLRYVFLFSCVVIVATLDFYLVPGSVILLYIVAGLSSVLTRIKLEKK